MTGKREKVEENTVAVIVSLCEKIENRKEFYDKIVLKVIPVGGCGIKPTASSCKVGTSEQLMDIFGRMINQDLTFR